MPNIFKYTHRFSYLAIFQINFSAKDFKSFFAHIGKLFQCQNEKYAYLYVFLSSYIKDTKIYLFYSNLHIPDPF